MKKAISSLLAGALFFWTGGPSVLAAITPPRVGEPLPALRLPVPRNSSERTYLGISEKGYFRISQIQTKVVIIEIFSMYCPFCQREAPEVNRLYKEIEENPNLKGKIKLMGIGAGNSSFEVDIFRKKYDIPFPLFPDSDFSFHKTFGEVRTPYFIGLRINPDGSDQVFYSKLGGLKGVGRFLKTILKDAGLEPQ
jgi:peroxiredoxin